MQVTSRKPIELWRGEGRTREGGGKGEWQEEGEGKREKGRQEFKKEERKGSPPYVPE